MAVVSVNEANNSRKVFIDLPKPPDSTGSNHHRELPTF